MFLGPTWIQGVFPFTDSLALGQIGTCRKFPDGEDLQFGGVTTSCYSCWSDVKRARQFDFAIREPIAGFVVFCTYPSKYGCMEMDGAHRWNQLLEIGCQDRIDAPST